MEIREKIQTKIHARQLAEQVNNPALISANLSTHHYYWITTMTKSIFGASKFLSHIASACLFLMMVQVVLDVILKYVFNNPIEGNLELVSFYYMVAVVFLSLAIVEIRHEHINVDLFVLQMPKTYQKYIYALSSILASFFFGILAYQTLIDAVRSTLAGEVMMGTNLVSIWPSRWALPIGFGLICIVTLHHAWRALTERNFNPKPASPEL